MQGEKINLFDEDTDSSEIDKNQDYSLFSEDDIKQLTENENPGVFNYSVKDISQTEKPESFIKILIADDENDVITITKLALNDFKFQEKNLHFFEASNKEEAKAIIHENDDIALIFLDVVMENNYDGLELVKYIREDLKNDLVQIVLRTGQPGYAPEREIISNYKINFYQTKSELTDNKLFTLTSSLLHSYHALKTIHNYNINLKHVIAEQTQHLRTKNEELQNVIASKNKLFSIIAHDLVNSFNSLLGFSDILRLQCETLPAEKIKQFAEIIWKTSGSTYNLLSNLLEWSRIQTGTINLTPQKVSLLNLITSNVNLHQLQARQKNLTINFTCNESINVYCDSFMINTVLRNLISNGIKFTKKGGININVSKNNDECLIEISDTGVGISAEILSELFSIENVSTKGTDGESGTGIGLVLCREFVTLNKGTISVTTEINKGTTFLVTLPLHQS